MKRIVVAILLLIFLGAVAAAEELAMFTGEAEVSLESLNVEAAKRRATEIALGQALESALSHAASAEELELKEKEIKSRILESPKRFIASFTILQTEERETAYHLELEARIRLDALRDEIRAIKVVRPPTSKKLAELVIIPYEKHGDGYALVGDFAVQLNERFDLARQTPAGTDVAEELLGASSFVTADRQANFTNLARTANAKGLRLMVLIEMANETSPDSEDFVCNLIGRISVIDTKEETLVDRISYRFPEQGACSEQMEEGAREMFGMILDSLTRHRLIGDSSDSQLTVEVIGLRDYAHLQELQALLRNRAYVQQADLYSFESGGRVIFKVTYGAPIQQFVTDMEKTSATSFRLTFSGRRGNQLQYSVEY